MIARGYATRAPESALKSAIETIVGYGPGSKYRQEYLDAARRAITSISITRVANGCGWRGASPGWLAKVEYETYDCCNALPGTMHYAECRTRSANAL